MAEVLSTKNEIELPSSSEKTSKGLNFGELAFEHVSFTYPGEDSPVLSDVSFRVKSGEKLAIMGQQVQGNLRCYSLFHVSTM